MAHKYTFTQINRSVQRRNSSYHSPITLAKFKFWIILIKKQLHLHFSNRKPTETIKEKRRLCLQSFLSYSFQSWFLNVLFIVCVKFEILNFGFLLKDFEKIDFEIVKWSLCQNLRYIFPKGKNRRYINIFFVRITYFTKLIFFAFILREHK